MYRLLRPLFFLLSPETAHHVAMTFFRVLCSIPFIRGLVRSTFTVRHPSLVKKLFGITFRNRVGPGAGFDKDGVAIRGWAALGLGFIELGTVTPRAQAGNARPRLFRLPTDKALINRMGFNNDGVDVIAKRLKEWKEKKRERNSQMVIGGNIGKNKVTPNEDAWQDYEICFNALHPYVDFFVVNVSSPNTPGLRALQEKDALHRILTHLQGLNRNYPVQKPILLKIAPDLTPTQVDDVIDLAREIRLDGLVATNTTISREGLHTPATEVEAMGAGGLSGKPLQQRSTEIIQYIHQRTGGTLPIIGSGGIFTAADAREKLAAGAALTEVWTGFIYEGPFIVKKINSGLKASH